MRATRPTGCTAAPPPYAAQQADRLLAWRETLVEAYDEVEQLCQDAETSHARMSASQTAIEASLALLDVTHAGLSVSLTFIH